MPAIGSKPVDDVTTEDVRAIIWRKHDECFDAAASVIRGLLKRSFDDMMAAGLTATNPVMAPPRRRMRRARLCDPALPPPKIRALLTAVMESNMRRQFSRWRCG